MIYVRLILMLAAVIMMATGVYLILTSSMASDNIEEVRRNAMGHMSLVWFWILNWFDTLVEDGMKS